MEVVASCRAPTSLEDAGGTDMCFLVEVLLLWWDMAVVVVVVVRVVLLHWTLGLFEPQPHCLLP